MQNFDARMWSCTESRQSQDSTAIEPLVYLLKPNMMTKVSQLFLSAYHDAGNPLLHVTQGHAS